MIHNYITIYVYALFCRDYMDKFLDEQEALVSRSSSPGEGKAVVANKTEAASVAASASANNNTIPIAPAVPSPQTITASQQPVT